MGEAFHDNSCMLRTSPEQSPGQGSWLPRLTTLLVWGLAMASVAYWALRLGTPADGLAPVPVASNALAQADASAVARALGATVQGVAAPVAQAPSRFVLTGVVADRRQGGAALIAINGQPARTYRVGAQVEPGLLLTSVGARRAVLAPALNAPPTMTLELAPLIPAARN